MQKIPPSWQAAIRHFQAAGGMLRTSAALTRGIAPRTLYALREAGTLELLDRGLYRLTSLPPAPHIDLITVAARVPTSVVCLVSALSFHRLTTQIPHAVSIAVPKGTEPPRLRFPPVELHWFSGKAYEAGIEQHTMDGAVVRIYDAEKTLVDCFRLRRLVGMDTVLEALRTYRARRGFDVERVLEYARICRVAGTITPYLETLL